MHAARSRSVSPSSINADTVELRTQEIGRELLAAFRQLEHTSPLSAKFWSDKWIAAALADDHFKTELFRFVDLFPVLKTPEQIHQHLLEYLQQPGIKLPPVISGAIKAGGFLKGTLARTTASQIEQMARTFIAGENLAAALPALQERWRERIAFSVDLLGEACVSHAEAAAYSGRYRTLIEELPHKIASWPATEQLERDHLGDIPRANVSIKISALDGHVSPVDAEGSLDRLENALAPLLELAGKNNVFINFDMEQHALKELTLRLFKRCCERHAFPAGLALQAYLRSAESDARDLAEWSRANGRHVTVRLLKGAYWDYETLHAAMQNWPAPVWRDKGETDACFERITAMLIAQTPLDKDTGGIMLALGTHNTRSVARAIAELESAALPQNAIEFQALRGMAEGLKSALAQRGWRVREYVPLGEMIPGMAYLVRRLLENTSNQGFVRAGQMNATDEALLAPPVDTAKEADHRRSEFSNEPLRDFSQASIRAAFDHALSAAQLADVPPDATESAAANAVSIAARAFPSWRDRAPTERAAIIQKAAAILRENRDSLAAQIMLESAKIRTEADGDVCEAVDFCEYYARLAVPLLTPHAPPLVGHFAGETNLIFHEPRGVAAIIAPWNFPLSICTGMTVAALVTGNTAIVKPAEQTPAIARRLCEALWKAGVPRDVVQYLPGKGEIVGAALVRDPRVAIVAFTGSKDVGLEIMRVAANTPPEQPFVKRIICEMGGKNAIIIDESADLDEAVLGVRQSAFGFAGQKCSAGSRLILLDSIHDAFLARLIESTRALVVGDPRNPGTDIGPVIDDAAAEKIRRYIEVGKQEATLVYPDSAGEIENRKLKTENPRLITPHIFTNVQPQHRIAREEIFGPVLTVLRARDFSHALALANDSAYKLTGGVYSRTPSHLERARREFRVGNLYLNRAITGALVGRQPFGGFGLSGVGAKAGGPDYLLQFTDPRAITENTLRRGFAPTDSPA